MRKERAEDLGKGRKKRETRGGVEKKDKGLLLKVISLFLTQSSYGNCFKIV